MIESKCNEGETEDCVYAHSEDTKTYLDNSEEKTCEFNSETAKDPEPEITGGKNWKISRYVDGS